MMFSDEDLLIPTAAEKQAALALMAGGLGLLLLGTLALNLFDLDIPGVALTIAALALVCIVLGPRQVAFLVNVLRFLRNGWR